MKIAYFDAFSGAAGDMLVGALIDAGAGFDRLNAALGNLGVPGFRLKCERVTKHGVTGSKFSVVVDEPDNQPHRHLRHIEAIIQEAELPEAVKEASRVTFRRIADVEADIHGTTPEKIHFHEVGAIDSIVDVIGFHLACHELGVEAVECSPLHVGAGTVQCAHGVMPVPAPATARLLGRAPYYGGDVQGELVTPTGAALLTQTARRFGAMPLLRGQAIGYGAGTRDLEDRPNVVRVVIGEAEEALPGTEPILVVESNMDDMNPEMYPPLLEALLEAGAREAFITPIVGKKGRPAHLVTALCHEPALAEVAQALFANSTTLGLRMRRDERICLEREWRDVNTPFGVVPVKLSKRGGRFTRPMPEFEDCRRLAAEHGVGVMTVYEAAREAAAREEAPHE